jgi:alkylated DNA repair dioxygenase AlkB
MSPIQTSLPGLAHSCPEGLTYVPELVTLRQEQELLDQFQRLQFREFEFHGYQGKRRIIYFGHRYDFAANQVLPAEALPEFLLPLRRLAASFAQVQAETLEHALVTEYAPGAGIGWHRDRPAFKDVIGISFASSCRFRFRRKSGNSWERYSLPLEPRSVYLLRGPARNIWEHSIPPSECLRYSVTFRSMV